MAVDMTVKSFLILFSVVCIIRYGSCAPIEEHIVLDNGTVLTMVIHDVQEAPPPRYSDSSIDVNSTDDKDNKPMIVIPEPQYAPAPRLISKRSADPGNTGDQDTDGKGEVKEPILPSTPRIEISKELGEVSTPSAVKDGAQTKKDVQGPGLDEKGLHSETAKVTEKPKSTELQDDQPEDEDEPEEEKVIIGKEQDRTTPVAVPIEPISKVGSSDAVDGSNSPEEKTEDAGDGNAKNGNSADDQSEKPDVVMPGEGKDNKPIDEDLNKKSSTENRDNELVNEAKDESISKPSVSTPSDESSDDGEETDDENGDQQMDDNNANGKEESEDDEEEGYEYEDPNSNKSEGNAASDESEDENEEEDGDVDDNELDENYSKGRPANSGEISDSEGGSSTLKKDVSKTQSSGHFMSYFLIAVVFVACFYLVFHNRQKIKAYVLEGKTGRARRRKAGNAEYRQLSTAEEVLPSADKGIESKITYTY